MAGPTAAAGMPPLRSAKDGAVGRRRSLGGISDIRRRRIQALVAALSQQSASFADSVHEALEADQSAGLSSCGAIPGLDLPAEEVPADRANCIDRVSSYEDETAILETGIVQAMFHDRCVMNADIHEYDSALQRVLREIRHLCVQVRHLERVSSRTSEIQQLLVQEIQAQEELHRENAKLFATNSELRSILHSALDAEGGAELDAFTDRLVLENDMLWKMVKVSQIASRISASTLQVPPLPRRQRPSLGSRSARSSTASSPTKCSPSGRREARLGVEVPAELTSPGVPGQGGVLMVDEEELETSPFAGAAGAGKLFVHAPKSPVGGPADCGFSALPSEVPHDGVAAPSLLRVGGIATSTLAMAECSGNTEDDDEAESGRVQDDVDLSTLDALG